MAWIETKKNGYLVCWRTPDGGRSAKKAPNHAAAKQLKRDVEDMLFRGEYSSYEQRKVLLGSWIESVIDHDASLRDSTKYGYRKDARPLEPLYGRPLGDLTTTEIRRALNDIPHPSSRWNAHRLLAKVLNQAVREGILTRSPLAGIPRPRVERKEIHPLTAQEIELLISHSREAYRPTLLLAAWGGLRAGEVAGLEPQDVDYLRRRITIRRQVSRVGGRRTVSDVKTAAGRRTIVVPGFVVEELGGLPFRTKVGNLLDAVVLNKACQDAAAKAGMRPVNFHLLRHTCASLLISQGAHPKQVQAHMGHTSISITMDVYGHLFPGLADDLADRMEALRYGVQDGKVVALAR